MNFKRRIGSKGQVVIPKDVRDFLSVEPGSEVVFEVKDEGAIMRPSKPPGQLIDEYLSILTPKLKSKIQVEELVEEEVLEEAPLRRQ
jgi:AbrB family looped-hinge helix DNA binding protein